MYEKSAEHYSWWQKQPIDVRDWPILIDEKSQLFVDDYMIAEKKNVEKQFHQPVTFETPVLLPEHPWEGVTCLAHGTVIKEASGRLRMYYTGFLLEAPIDMKRTQVAYNTVCMACSEDGIHWEKPELGLHPYGDRNDTNLFLPFQPEGIIYEQFSILYDEKEKDPGRRWKMGMFELGKGIFNYDPENPTDVRMSAGPYEGTGFYAYYSSDGLHWNKAPEPIMTSGWSLNPENWPLPGVSENESIMYDSVRNKFIAFVRIWDCRPGMPNMIRARAICESDDFIHWTTPRVLFLPLEDDEPGLQFYSSTGFNYESMYLGLLRCWRSGTTKQLYFQLVSSRDGQHWERAAHRQPFIDNAPLGTIGGGYHSDFSNPPIRMGGELWFYYGSSQFGKNVRPNIGGICLAKLRLDGFASIEGGYATGSLITRPLDFCGKQLTINGLPRKAGKFGVAGSVEHGMFVNTGIVEGKAGNIAVEILDRHYNPIEGYGLEDCIPVTEDAVASPVRWKNHGDLSALEGTTIRLKFYITHAGLYSFAIGKGGVKFGLFN
ncbi:hypothetical protein EHS13_05155 [Paenibacillus psychroresistens]|uniref:Glycosyl hydrolase family 32 N-terminal domain-containing protein n=1 Tax=Paenibacillus psychroresistens TaxID=1778678 RepID=A0A6B8REI2_9BACL|nr:hypothetical protein [Paenibacillus psychroresistens]QGQ94337.1 hypothetical protein EHS13_05155 [Paenibacillus psychroresistens]